MRPLPSSFVIHRHCPQANPNLLIPIGKSRDGKLTHLARPETVAAFQRMSEAAAAANIKFQIIWAHRSPDLQKKQFAEAQAKYGNRGGIRWLAPPGFSEHQTGWVLDIGDLSDSEADDNSLFSRTTAFRWLDDHAREFDFELSFPPGNWQGVGYEPWHWRFVGTPEARRAFHPQGVHAVSVWGRSWLESLRWWMHL